MTVEQKIKEIRKQMKISLEKLSEETGIERHIYSI